MLRTRLFITLLIPAFSKSYLLKSKRHCLKQREKKVQTQWFIIYFINTSWIPSPDLSQSGKKRKHCHLFWYPLVSTSLGSGCHMSLLVYATARDRLGAHKSAVGQKGEQKEKWRGGGKGGKGGGEEGVLSHHRPMSLYFPLIICGPCWLQSLNHTSPEDSEGTWEGLLSQTSVWKLYWSLSLCRSMATSEGPGEIRGRGNDRVEG